MLTFSHSNPWATLNPSSTTGQDLSPTAELDPLLSHLSTTLAFLSRALAPAPLRRIARAVLVTINSTLFDSVLRLSFSTQGAAQLTADLNAICAVVDKQVGAGVAEVALRRCLEAARLVGLPVKGGRTTTTRVSDDSGAGDEDEDGMDEWDAWAADDPQTSGTVPQKATLKRGAATISDDFDVDGDVHAGPNTNTQTSGLWEVERRLFADNQSARLVLEELGLELLDEKEARRVLRLRVELAG